MSGKMHLVVGLVMLALGLGLAIGSGIFAATAHGQSNGAVARSANYAIVPGIRGVRNESQLLYIIDDATQAVYVLEVAARGKPNETVVRRGWCDLRSMAEAMQAKRKKP